MSRNVLLFVVAGMLLLGGFATAAMVTGQLESSKELIVLGGLGLFLIAFFLGPED